MALAVSERLSIRAADSVTGLLEMNLLRDGAWRERGKHDSGRNSRSFQQVAHVPTPPASTQNRKTHVPSALLSTCRGYANRLHNARKSGVGLPSSKAAVNLPCLAMPTPQPSSRRDSPQRSRNPAAATIAPWRNTARWIFYRLLAPSWLGFSPRSEEHTSEL